MAKDRNVNGQVLRGTWYMTKWPEATPSIHEDRIISVSIGNTHIYWALHEGISKHLVPTLFWRTKHLDPDMSGDPTEMLSTLIPTPLYETVFGSESADASKEMAIAASAMRRVSFLKIYVVSTNTRQLELFSWLWQDIPCRIYLMRGDDFFTVEEGRYPGMGIDRLATLRAAGDFSGFPALVFDGGTAETYTAADANGKIMGGGIGPGVLVKLRGLRDYADALPNIKFEDILEEIAALEERGTPLPIFARDPKQAIVSNLLNEIAQTGTSVVKQFLKEVGPAVPSGTEDKENEKDGVGATSENTKRTVLVCGGDAEIVSKLIEPNHSNLVPVQPGQEESTFPPYEVKIMKHMVHYGITAVLKKKVTIMDQDPNREMDIVLIGQRVAKTFPQADSDGEFTYRGAVSAVSRDEVSREALYFVRYDDGDGEDLNAEDLYEALSLYVKVGEKNHGADALSGVRMEPRGVKIDGAQRAANKLAAENGKVKAAIEKKKKKSAFTPPLTEDSDAIMLKDVMGRSPGTLNEAPPGSKRPLPAKAPREKKAKKPKSAKQPTDYIGMRVSKYFPDYKEIFFGTIDKYSDGLWNVKYDDSDEEEFDQDDLATYLKHYAKHKADDPTPVPTTARASSDSEDD